MQCIILYGVIAFFLSLLAELPLSYGRTENVEGAQDG
jgi:hypothetical protein